jgi:predicted glycoside hydrolase/deacetylase ChbG (UPF0249 family)
MKSLTLCADDFGLAPASDRVMLQLAERGRLGTVSCIVNTPGWAAAATALAGSGLACGLHLNLTEGRPLSPALAAVWPVLPALPRLIVQAHLRQLPRAALRDELRAQLDAFEQHRGQAPGHIDGHQHVHHLPVVRELLLDLLADRPGVLVRNTGSVRGPGFALKRALIAATGGRTLGRRLAALRAQQNGPLFGVYDFGGSPGYRTLMQRWLAALPERGALLFCHPGAASAGDAISQARAREAAYFGSEAFTDDLAAAGVRLA